MGEDAKKIGLVDEIGGFEAAVAASRRLLDLPADAPIRLRSYPRDPSIFKRILGSRNSLDQQKANASVWAGLASWLVAFPIVGRSMASFIHLAVKFSRNYSRIAASPAVGAVMNVVESGALIASEPALALAENPVIL